MLLGAACDAGLFAIVKYASFQYPRRFSEAVHALHPEVLHLHEPLQIYELASCLQHSCHLPSG